MGEVNFSAFVNKMLSAVDSIGSTDPDVRKTATPYSLSIVAGGWTDLIPRVICKCTLWEGWGEILGHSSHFCHTSVCVASFFVCVADTFLSLTPHGHPARANYRVGGSDFKDRGRGEGVANCRVPGQVGRFVFPLWQAADMAHPGRAVALTGGNDKIQKWGSCWEYREKGSAALPVCFGSRGAAVLL